LLADFRRDLESATLSVSDARQIVASAQNMLELAYANLPQKRAMYAVDPVQRLRLLAFRLSKASDMVGADVQRFHAEMLEIFNLLRDLHTVYSQPPPYADATAFLPFLIEQAFDPDRADAPPRYLVTKVHEETTGRALPVGAEVLYWNGTPMRAFVTRLAAAQAGGNDAARLARALETLTIRPLKRQQPPAEDWVVLTFKDVTGKARELRQPWFVQRDDPDFAQQANQSIGVSAFDEQWRAIQAMRHAAFAPRRHRGASATRIAAKRARTTDKLVKRVETVEELGTAQSGVLRVRKLRVDNRLYGHVRIFSFLVGASLQENLNFIFDVAEVVAKLPKNGLILDVRGNGGGSIYAAEGLLQLFTERKIHPELAQFVCSPLTEALAGHYDDLKPWQPSIAQSIETGALHSGAFALTPAEAFANHIGQRYTGPVVLVTDPLSYSATDIFAAGFVDHEIGPVLGVGDNTGAGGANVWEYGELRTLASPTSRAADLPPLPAGVGMRVGIRRMLRVNKHAGIPLEDFGISVTARHRLTTADLMHNNQDLLHVAVGLLRSHAGKQRTGDVR
jgi:hypothetical protein